MCVRCCEQWALGGSKLLVYGAVLFPQRYWDGALGVMTVPALSIAVICVAGEVIWWMGLRPRRADRTLMAPSMSNRWSVSVDAGITLTIRVRRTQRVFSPRWMGPFVNTRRMHTRVCVCGWGHVAMHRWLSMRRNSSKWGPKAVVRRVIIVATAWAASAVAAYKRIHHVPNAVHQAS